MNGIKPLSFFINSNECVKLPLLKTKDLCSFMVRVTSIKFIYNIHAKKYRLENARITNALSPTLSIPKLQFLFARVHSTHATLQILIVRNYLLKHLDIIINYCHIQVTSLVSRCLQSLVMHSLGKVAQRHLR